MGGGSDETWMNDNGAMRIDRSLIVLVSLVSNLLVNCERRRTQYVYHVRSFMSRSWHSPRDCRTNCLCWAGSDLRNKLVP